MDTHKWGETKNSGQVRKKISTVGMQQMCTTDQNDSKLAWAKRKSLADR